MIILSIARFSNTCPLMQIPRCVYNERDIRIMEYLHNVFICNFLFSYKEKKHWNYDLLLSWIICMVDCIGVRTDGYVNKHIFIVHCILVFTTEVSGFILITNRQDFLDLKTLSLRCINRLMPI